MRRNFYEISIRLPKSLLLRRKIASILLAFRKTHAELLPEPGIKILEADGAVETEDTGKERDAEQKEYDGRA